MVLKTNITAAVPTRWGNLVRSAFLRRCSNVKSLRLADSDHTERGNAAKSTDPGSTKQKRGSYASPHTLYWLLG